jgi:hypothetical protein
MLKKYLIYFYLAIYAILSGCNVGGNGSNASQNPVPFGSAEVQIGNITTIPADNYRNGEYSTVVISNNADSDVTLQHTQINANGLNQNADIVSSNIDLSDCLHIGTGKSCKAKVLTNPTLQSYLLSLTFSDSTGKEYTASQIISTNNSLPVQAGFIYDATQLSMVGKTRLSIPFRLADDYGNVSVTINDNPIEFSCNQNKHTKNTLCTAIVKNSDLTEDETQIKIISYNSSGKKTSILALGNNQGANIITSGRNVVINPNDGTNKQTIFLVNNGVVNATNIKINPQTPVTIESVTCTSTLAPNAICSFAVNVTGSILSGQSSVNISYLDGQNTQALNFNVSYINQVSPALTLTQSGNFNNIVESTGPIFVSVNVKNSGNTDFTNLQFNNLNLQNSSMSSFTAGSSCTNGQSLGVGQSCVMVLSYSPLEAQSGTVNFIPTATYLGPGGQTLTYTNSILNLAYSSITSASFVAVGDYGTTLSSTAATTPTWSANIDSPFATNSIIANGMVINGNTYAVMLNTGVVEYSTQNGLFWSAVPATATGLGNTNCSIVYDGTKYYSCGTANASTTAPCSSLNSCIISSTNLVSWSKLYRPATSGALNNIFYFGDPFFAVIAAQASTTAGRGLSMSTNGGVSFSEPATGFGGTTEANFNIVAFNSSISRLNAWHSNGFSTSLTSPSTTWLANGSNRPEASIIGGAVNVGGQWYLGTYAGKIFSSNVTYNQFLIAFTGSSANPIKGLAYNSTTSTFLAATGAGGPIYKAGAGTWTVDTSSPGNYTSVYLNGNDFWLTGTNAIYTSPTVPPAAGSTWRAPALISIAKNGTSYLATDTKGFIYSSSNLTTWIQQTNPSGKKLSAITCPTTNLCLAVGESGTIIKYNGTSWAQLSSGVTTNTYLRGITCQPYPGICLAVGGTGAASSGTVLLSNSDFTSWTIKTSNLATTNLNGAGFLNDLFIVVGDAGALFISTNEGDNWSSKTSGAGANNLNSIACGHLGCVAVGNGGSIVYSATGNRWDLQTSGVTTNLNSIVINGLFVAVGNTSGSAGVIRQSVNGTSWNTGIFPSTSSGTTNLYSVISK